MTDKKEPKEMKELFTALSNFQATAPVIERSEKVEVGKYSYKFAPLPKIVEEIRPHLKKNGLGFTQMLTSYSGRSGIKTIIFHESGEYISENVELPINTGATAQQHGSAISYFRRYALTAALGIVTDDDIDAQDQKPVSPETKRKLWDVLKTDYSKNHDGVVPGNTTLIEYIHEQTGKPASGLYEEDALALIKLLED